MNHIVPIPAFQDNYIWAIINSDRNIMAVVDPGDATPVLEYLHDNKLILDAILITHHHGDHTGGIAALSKQYSNIPVYGPKSVRHVTHTVEEADIVTLKSHQLKFNVIETPGHTLDHIAYYSKDTLFCGDTLFSIGCGRVFEGTFEQMLSSLDKIKQLNDELKVCCAHEYTLSNLAFALNILPQDTQLANYNQECQSRRERGQPTLPSTLKLEKSLNPFLRCDDTTVQKALGEHCDTILHTPVETFTLMRQLKDVF